MQPLIEYQPPDSWSNGRTRLDGTASFDFYGKGHYRFVEWHSRLTSSTIGTGIQLYGHANQTAYEIRLDGQLQHYTQRHYSPDEPAIKNVKSSVDCSNPAPGECVLIAEFFGLNPNEMHNLLLTAKLLSNPALGRIDIMLYSTLFETNLSP